MSTTPPEGTTIVPDIYEPPAHTATETVKDAAGTAKDAAKDVAGTAKDEAVNVAGEARDQAQQLLHRTRGEVSDQVSTQQERLASSLRTIGQELSAMSEGGRQQGQTQDVDQEPRAASGIASDLSGQLADVVTRSADWLEGRQPADVLDELRGFARRKPGTFLVVAGVAGLLAGRLTRGAASSSGSSSSGSAGTSPSAWSPSAGSPSGVLSDVSGPGVPTSEVIPSGFASNGDPASGFPNGVSQTERTTVDDELFGRPTESRT